MFDNYLESELVQLKLNIETSVGESTPTEAEYGVPLPLVEVGVSRLDDYQESLEYLVNLTTFGINFGLGRIQELLKRLGNPEKALRVVHVGGTNGKGSTTVMIARILQEAGYKVGVFTSPHLHDWRERMVINGQMISK